jgi:hypothetical protein
VTTTRQAKPKAAPRKKAVTTTEPRPRGRPSLESQGKAPPLTTVERRKRSDAEKIARGEFRLTTWLSSDAHAALRRMTDQDDSRGAVQAAVNTALTSFFKD